MRKLLPLIGSHPGGRSALTCRFRCGDACFHETPNTSDNAYVGDVIAGVISRRSALRAAAVVTVAGAAAPPSSAPAPSRPSPTAGAPATGATAPARGTGRRRAACGSLRSPPTPGTR
ncbi:twin-arginine translocation signal domain-containing protein [Actinomadura keratinilytica]